MQYVLSIIFSLILVVAQASWKVSVGANPAVFHSVTVSKLIGFVFAPLTILGAVLYVLATGLYMFLLSRYQFSTIQATAIPLTLIFSITMGLIFFGDHLSMLSLLGIALIAAGIVVFALG